MAKVESYLSQTGLQERIFESHAIFHDKSYALVSWTILPIIIPGSSLVWVQTDITPIDFEKIRICILNFHIKVHLNFSFFGVHLAICTYSSTLDYRINVAYEINVVLRILVKNYRFSKIFVLEAYNLAWSDEVTSMPYFGQF